MILLNKVLKVETTMKSLQKGFTLLELMVTISIVGIVAAIALWDSSDLLENDRAESYLQELKRSISFARAKATSSDAIVVVCSGATANIESNTAMNCSNGWDQGTVFVFFDSDQNGSYNPANGDTTLRVLQEIPKTSKLSFSGNNALIFDTSGMITSDSGTFTFCPSGANDNNKALQVFKSGTVLYLGDTTNTCD